MDLPIGFIWSRKRYACAAFRPLYGSSAAVSEHDLDAENKRATLLSAHNVGKHLPHSA